MTADSVFVPIASPSPETPSKPLQSPEFVLEWKNLTLEVTPDDKNAPPKTILHDIHGHANPGELLVVMGPSGAGKTSLFDCLSGRNNAALTANPNAITINGEPFNRDMRQLVTYVLQADLFYETLTVYEHLLFQARLRMGKTHTKQECVDQVETIMKEFGLADVRDSMIGGGDLVRGLSGGERKRLSIASEMLGTAAIYFVDEPTSGLDSFMAESVVSQLQYIARKGKTVITTIHQPSSDIFALFDKLYLMSAGSVVYHGPASKVVEYFSSLGFPCPAYLNPADYFMRQLTVMNKGTDTVGTNRVKALVNAWEERHQQFEPPTESVPMLTNGDPWGASYESSHLGGLAQVGVIMERNLTRLTRDHMAFRVSIVRSIVLAVIVGLIFIQLDLTQSGIQNFVGVFYFVVVTQTMTTATGEFGSVPLELGLVMREYNGGLYHVLSWYAAKNISEFPMQILLPILFYTPLYFLVGISHGVEVFFGQLAFVILVNSAAAGIGYMISCLVRRVDIAPVLGVVFLMPMVLLGGLMVNVDDIPVYLVWLEYIAPPRYGYDGLMKVFWHHVDTISCNAAVENCIASTGEDVLLNYSMQARSVWFDAIILIVLNLSFRAVGFLGLLRNLRRS